MPKQGLKNRLKLRYWISVKSVLATTRSFLKKLLRRFNILLLKSLVKITKMKLKLINAEVKIFERLRSRMSVTFPYRIKVSEFSNEILEFQRAVS